MKNQGFKKRRKPKALKIKDFRLITGVVDYKSQGVEKLWKKVENPDLFGILAGQLREREVGFRKGIVL